MEDEDEKLSYIDFGEALKSLKVAMINVPVGVDHTGKNWTMHKIKPPKKKLNDEVSPALLKVLAEPLFPVQSPSIPVAAPVPEQIEAPDIHTKSYIEKLMDAYSTYTKPITPTSDWMHNLFNTYVNMFHGGHSCSSATASMVFTHTFYAQHNCNFTPDEWIEKVEQQKASSVEPTAEDKLKAWAKAKRPGERIIGICGPSRSGKDTAADYLVSKYHLWKLSFADSFKRFLHSVFSFKPSVLWGEPELRNAWDKRYTEGPCQAWENALTHLREYGRSYVTQELGQYGWYGEDAYRKLLWWFGELRRQYPKLTPRIALQSFGSQFGREMIHDDLWVLVLLRTYQHLSNSPRLAYTSQGGIGGGFAKAKKPFFGAVVSDVRFANERKGLKDRGAILVKIERKEALEGESVGIQGHASEIEAKTANNEEFDYVITNDGTIEELHAKLDKIMEEILDVSKT